VVDAMNSKREQEDFGIASHEYPKVIVVFRKEYRVYNTGDWRRNHYKS
jgi:hypothetical protein